MTPLSKKNYKNNFQLRFVNVIELRKDSESKIRERTRALTDMRWYQKHMMENLKQTHERERNESERRKTVSHL